MNRTLTAANDDDIVVECDLPAAPDKVWRALTVPELVARWLLPNSMGAARPGEQFEFDGSRHGLSGRIDCKVLEAEPGQRLSYDWREADGTSSVVTFELIPREDGTRLRITQGMPAPQPLMAANGNAPALALAA